MMNFALKKYDLCIAKLRKEVIRAKNIGTVFRRSEQSTSTFSLFAIAFAVRFCNGFLIGFVLKIDRLKPFSWVFGAFSYSN